MTQKALIECLSTIDSHFGKQPSPEARRAEIQVYISVLGNIPDEIALKALPAAFAVCRYQAFRKERGVLPGDVARTALAAHQAV